MSAQFIMQIRLSITRLVTAKITFAIHIWLNRGKEKRERKEENDTITAFRSLSVSLSLCNDYRVWNMQMSSLFRIRKENVLSAFSFVVEHQDYTNDQL